MTEEPRFLADAMLGRLARWLRLLGYDTAYDSKIDDNEVVYRSLKEGRIVLTRDRGLSRSRSLRLLLIRDETVQAQLLQVLRELPLRPSQDRALSRCSLCNVLLEPVAREAAVPLVPAAVAQTQKSFSRCPSCDKIYWLGSHWKRFQKALEKVKE